MLWKSHNSHEKLYNFFSDVQQKYLRMELVDQVLEQDYFDQEALLSGKSHMIDEATKAYVDAL
ncbi:MAG: hypothetical protein Q4B28_00850 [bacterium]|nr:hypothetical protein [bacterium]